MNRLVAKCGFVYLTLFGLLFDSGCSPSKPSTIATSSRPAAESPTNVESKVIAVRVTGMMCPHSCLKDVETILEKQNDIVSIELTPQKEVDVIDNPVVMVTYRGEIHHEATTKAIMAAGFEKVDYFVPETK